MIRRPAVDRDGPPDYPTRQRYRDAPAQRPGARSGGTDGNTTGLDSAELYDPVTGALELQNMSTRAQRIGSWR
jgi:hypothetical protein